MTNKKIVSKGLEVFGKIWAFGVFLLVLAGLIGIWISEGFGRVQEIFSPFNVINWLVIFILLSPSLSVLYLAEKIKSKGHKTTKNNSKINRSNFMPIKTKDPETGKIDIGWDEGTLNDGRPYRLEFWSTSGISMLTYFISTEGIESYTTDNLKQLLISNGLIEFLAPEPSIVAKTFTDPANNEFWSINIVLGDEYNLNARDNSNLKQYDS